MTALSDKHYSEGYRKKEKDQRTLGDRYVVNGF